MTMASVRVIQNIFNMVINLLMFIEHPTFDTTTNSTDFLIAKYMLQHYLVILLYRTQPIPEFESYLKQAGYTFTIDISNGAGILNLTNNTTLSFKVLDLLSTEQQFTLGKRITNGLMERKNPWMLTL
jgi:hypothetical protein